jgi:homoserine O-acetyltransferase
MKKFFVICPNAINGCMCLIGPALANPSTGKVSGLDLPVITILNMVQAHAMLVDHFGIGQLFYVIGSLIGRTKVLE